ncbi:prephenate dehydrogenase [Jeotgalibacillus alimentarius]|uniref:Prephenate dehydrogenase n=1 Tax=Jeotgalibacillus alimentarius TaxID=135826 RepID=A0A0C2VJ57_9BACL|nr:prephenate dehydrogenase [Jeotgalibacillus alimentarius]KIL48927.1 prephenate dehydrogenase [Jeotgalibacillus alimentarius]
MNGNVFIIGLGLIGGSIGLSILKEYPGATVTGFDIKKEEIRLAKALNAISQGSDSLQEDAERADLIIICTPVNETVELMKTISSFNLKPGVIVTDVGSTKKRIMESSHLFSEKGISFIGGHPMAGSHKSGVSAAKAILFENAFYLLTPAEPHDTESVAALKKWLKGSKAKFLEVKPEEHDHITGMVSHFPHIIASSLVHQVKDNYQRQPLISSLAAGGFRDISRIASSNPEMWRDITVHNIDTLKTLMSEWQEEMNRVIDMLERNNAADIHAYFSEAKTFRDSMPILQKGAIPSFYDLFVDVPDYPGVISEITGILAKEEISIVNLRIMETREDIYGVLTISFQTEEDRKRGADCISSVTEYDVFTV